MHLNIQNNKFVFILKTEIEREWRIFLFLWRISEWNQSNSEESLQD